MGKLYGLFDVFQGWLENNYFLFFENLRTFNGNPQLLKFKDTVVLCAILINMQILSFLELEFSYQSVVLLIYYIFQFLQQQPMPNSV